MDIFKQASKLGLRFQTSKGVLTVEQLWHLSLIQLADCVKGARKILKENEDGDDLSFLDTKVVVNQADQLRFDILKDIYLTKKADAEARREEENKREYKQKIVEIIAEKREGQLKDKSIEELEALLK